MKFAAVHGLVKEMELEVGLSLLKKAGYEGVELNSSSFIANPAENGKARRFSENEMPELLKSAERCREIVEDAGLEVIGFTPGGFTMCYFDDDFYENYYRLARALGAPCLKVAGTIYRPDDNQTYWDLLRESQRKLKVLTGYGAENGVRTLVELHHGYLNESCSGAYILLKDFDPKLVGVIHDPQNMVVAGKERWKMGLEILGDYLAYVHFKNSDFKRNKLGEWQWSLTLLKDGLVDWNEFVGALKEIGYDGYLCNEFMGDKNEIPPKVYIEDEMEYLRKCL